MKTNYLFLAVMTSLFLASCTNESTSDLIDINPIEGDITYTNTIRSIINNNCVRCHAAVPTNGAPMSLTTYEDVRDAVLRSGSRGIINRITRNTGDALLMPQGGPKLPQPIIDQIIQWEAAGLQE